jgi:hypothetical protein
VQSSFRQFLFERTVRRDAQRCIRKVKASGEKARGLFIDCGSNVGQGFSYFRTYFPPEYFDYILVEPNPYCVGRLKTLASTLQANVRIIDAAAGTRTGEAKLYGLTEDERGKVSQGGSILKDHNSIYYDENILPV